MKKYTLIAAALVLLVMAAGSVQAQTIFIENFNGYSGTTDNTQYQTGLPVATGGNVPGWSKSGAGAVHAVNLGSGNMAIMFYQDNVITLTTGIAANDNGVAYKVEFDYGTATYNEGTQATAAGDGLLVEVVRADNSVLASGTYTNSAWSNPANVNLSAGLHGTLQYVGDGSGVVRLRIGPTPPLTSGRFEGEIDNLSVSLTSLIVTLTAPTVGQQFPLGSSVTATATVANGTAPYTVNFYTNYNSGAYGLAGMTNASPYTINLVPLAAGTYGIYATVTDNVSSNAASATNTCTVFVPFDRTAWGCSMPITFTNDARLNTLTNFPVLVVLDTNKVNYSQFQANAQDLRFADMNGIELAYQVESWNTTSNSYVWVKIPTLTAGCTITAYWGNSGASMPSYRTNGLAWDSTFAGVWHLGEAGNTTAGGYKDSSTNVNHGTGVAMTAGTEVVSMISTGQNLNGTSQEIQAADSTSLRPTAAITMSAWIKATSIASGSHTHLMLKQGGSPATSYGLWTDPSKKPYFETAGGSLTGNTVLNASTWYHVAATYDGSNMRVYLNGAQDGSVGKTGAIGGYAANPLRMGHGPWNNWFNGIMDEVRVSNVGRSANWIWAEYMNIASNGNFQVLGTPQSRVRGTVICIF